MIIRKVLGIPAEWPLLVDLWLQDLQDDHWVLHVVLTDQWQEDLEPTHSFLAIWKGCYSVPETEN